MLNRFLSGFSNMDVSLLCLFMVKLRMYKDSVIYCLYEVQ